MSEGPGSRPTRIDRSELGEAAVLPIPEPANPDASGSKTARRSVTVAAWTLISRLTGLLRIVVIGAHV